MRQALAGIGWFILCWAPVQADDTRLDGVRVWPAPDHTRVVFDVSGPVARKVFTLAGPDRVVIDLPATRLTSPLGKDAQGKGRVKQIRSGKRNKDGLRLVLDVEHAVRPKSFLLPPNASYGHRLVVDLYDAGEPARSGPVAKPRKVARTAPSRQQRIIAIDAGHGGDDPGARGPSGVREKDVVLGIARKTAALINREPGMRAVLVRDGDYYVGLRNRMRKARKHQADLFISIHADAFRDRRVRGSSVYVVSNRGASTEMARWLAERENASDLAGGVSLDDKDDLLKTVLLDLSQSASREASMAVATNVLRELGHLGKTHKSRVQQAGFMVLKSPDIPSILIETAFISNPAEERRLSSPRHQQHVAEAIARGVRNYFGEKKRPDTPAGTRWAGTRHLIKRGETLSGIAQRYKVSVRKIRLANDLASDRVQAGKVLKIPAGG